MLEKQLWHLPGQEDVVLETNLSIVSAAQAPLRVLRHLEGIITTSWKLLGILIFMFCVVAKQKLEHAYILFRGHNTGG